MEKADDEISKGFESFPPSGKEIEVKKECAAHPAKSA
jgi:hypothetical protein